MSKAQATSISATEFEKLVAQTVRLLGVDGATVEHNVRVVDPDTGKWRQVDILVQYQNDKRHYECRHHSSPQDVKWIEELIGRKKSLNANEMVAVSSSGFTLPAITKAKVHSIGLLDLRAISHQLLSDLPEVFCEWLVFSNMKIHLGSDIQIRSHHAVPWVSKLRLASYEFLERLVGLTRNEIIVGETFPFCVKLIADRPKLCELNDTLVVAKRLHLSGAVSCNSMIYSVIKSFEVRDLLASNWLANIHSFGVNGCYFVDSSSVRKLFLDSIMLKLPKGSALTKFAVYDSERYPVVFNINIREMRKPQSLYAVEISHEDWRETMVHRAFQAKQA